MSKSSHPLVATPKDRTLYSAILSALVSRQQTEGADSGASFSQLSRIVEVSGGRPSICTVRRYMLDLESWGLVQKIDGTHDWRVTPRGVEAQPERRGLAPTEPPTLLDDP